MQSFNSCYHMNRIDSQVFLKNDVDRWIEGKRHRVEPIRVLADISKPSHKRRGND